MKRITTTMLLAAGLALAGCNTTANKDAMDSSVSGSSSGSMTSGSTGSAGATSTSGTTGGVDAANADVKGSTSATGATPANTGERR